MEQTFNFKEIQNREDRLAPGHRMCAGCGGTIATRNVLKALHPGDKAVIGNATGCLEVSTFMYPYTAYEDSYIHTAFANAGATLAGVSAGCGSVAVASGLLSGTSGSSSEHLEMTAFSDGVNGQSNLSFLTFVW